MPKSANRKSNKVVVENEITLDSVSVAAVTQSGTWTVGVSKTALTASSPTAATVGTSSAQAVASNANRKGLILVNTSGNVISLGFGAAAVLNSGVTLAAGGSFIMDVFSFTTAAVNAIAAGAGSNLAVQEFAA